VLKYNTVPMKEAIGSPAQWDKGPWPAGFAGRLRLTAERAYNVPIWGYFYFFSFFQDKGYGLKPGGQAYLDLGYAASVVHKLSPCSGYPGPSLRMQRFAHAYSDYILLPTIEVKPKVWGRVIAQWSDGSPSIVVSRRPGLRVAFVASRLPGDYSFGQQAKPLGRSPFKQNWRTNLWLMAAVYNELLRWAAGLGANSVSLR